MDGTYPKDSYGWRGKRIAALEAENERLREALRAVVDYADGTGGHDVWLDALRLAEAALAKEGA
jgi:hypothetical protein